jgi:predicted phosphodiesterase
VLVIPGNHDVQWWWRPFIPFAKAALYGKYRRYFGPLTPHLEFPEVMIQSALTSHGVAWGSLTPRLRDIAVKGHLPKREWKRVSAAFGAAPPGKARVLVLHHNVLRGQLSQRMGLARWKQAQRRLVASGADVILCGHDHQESIEALDGRIAVSCAGTLSTRSRGGRPSSFNCVSIEEESIQVELYSWESARRLFRRTDMHAFARPSRPAAPAVVPAAR